jgi:serine/threonine protein kinase
VTNAEETHLCPIPTFLPQSTKAGSRAPADVETVTPAPIDSRGPSKGQAKAPAKAQAQAAVATPGTASKAPGAPVTDSKAPPAARTAAKSAPPKSIASKTISPGGAAGTTMDAHSRRRADGPPPQLAELQKDPEKIVQQYVLVELLGKGGMGQVWKAWDTKLLRWVAIKFLTLNDEESIKRFDREAHLAARLRHPNIAAIYDLGQEKDRHYLVMDFVDGVSMGKARLEMRPAIEAIAKCARALEVAHEAGVIHRDLKPENLMITPAGWPYVMDFGLAKSVEAESNLSVSGDVMGTPSFMSPEQARGEIDQLDARTDIYSLGATLYALLTGQRPFAGKTTMEILMKVVNGDLVPPRKHKPELPVPVEAIILKAMEKDRERRYPTASAFADDLERFLADADVEAKLPSLTSLVVRRIRRNLIPYLLGFGLLVSAAVALVSWAARSNSAWMEAFRTGRRSLEYATFKPEDEDAVKRMRDLLSTASDLSDGDRRETTDWFRTQLEIAERDGASWKARPKADWPGLKAPATRARAWSDEVKGILQELGQEGSLLLPRVAEFRKSADQVLGYRGAFRLKVAVMPFAVVEDVRRGGQSIALKDRQTPLVLDDLEIDDYEIVLSHPSLAGTTVSLPASRLANGTTYILAGDLRKEGSIQIR